jgi:inner membrane protein involved in colicin E2 resistance
LLISLSEHIAFDSAYLIAAAACIGLIGFYLSAVLRSRALGASFAAALAVLYAALYGLLASEDNALVLGAGLLFVSLATLMLATRRLTGINWVEARRHEALTHPKVADRDSHRAGAGGWSVAAVDASAAA